MKEKVKKLQDKRAITFQTLCKYCHLNGGNRAMGADRERCYLTNKSREEKHCPVWNRLRNALSIEQVDDIPGARAELYKDSLGNSEGYAVLQDAKKGHHLGIHTLALVDRKKTRDLWWTSDSTHLIMRFNKRSAAEATANRLVHNVHNIRVVDYDSAVKMIQDQDNELMHHEANAESEMGWDAHKDC